MKSKSIFKRCGKCEELHLKEEKHSCRSKERYWPDFQNEALQILQQHGEPMLDTEIIKIINKKHRQKNMGYWLGVKLRENPKTFKEVKPRLFGLKAWSDQA